MQPDEARLADVRAWITRARTDLRVAAHDLTPTPPFLGDAAFHSQQAVEKALKGFLAWHDEPFRKTHILTELGEQCVELDPSLEPLLAKVAPLSEYAWKFRYPGEPSQPPEDEIQEALRLAEEVYNAIVERLPDGIESEEP